MDRSKKFMQNVADLACQMNLNQLERSTMAYKCLCLELESMSNAVIPAVTPPTSPPPAAGVPSKGLRASASEFVPQVPLTSDRISIELDNEQDEDSDNDGYDEERNRAPKPAIYGLRFYSHHYDVDVSDNHLEAEKKRKYGYRAPKFRPNQPPGQSVKSETSSTAIAKPPPELVNGQPHFKGPYMPLLQHRISNAEAYGLIQGSDERNSLLLEDMVKQLARLDNCPFNLSSLFPDKENHKKANVPLAKTKAETPCTKDTKEIEAKPSENKESSPRMAVEKAKTHRDQMSALSTMPLRLDYQIQCIKTLQQELFKLHLKQMLLLDGCADFLHELNNVQPTDDCEEKIVLETFREVKSKLSDVFERYLPAQLDMLKQESKILQMSSEMISK